MRKLLPALVGFFAGLAVAALYWPGLYIFGTIGSETFRVNRLTGVKEFSTASGWRTEQGMMREVEAQVRPEVARFDERIDEMIAAHRSGDLVDVQLQGRQVTAFYRDGSTGVYYAATPEDPRISQLQNAVGRRIEP